LSQLLQHLASVRSTFHVLQQFSCAGWNRRDVTDERATRWRP